MICTIFFRKYYSTYIVLDRTGQDKTEQDRTGQDRDRTFKPQFCDLELPVVLLCHIKFNHQIVGFLVEFNFVDHFYSLNLKKNTNRKFTIHYNTKKKKFLFFKNVVLTCNK